LQFANIRKLTAIWACVVIVIWITAWLVGFLSTPNRPGLSFPRGPVETLSTWDTAHYQAIARNGYSAQGWESRRLAFFPLLPLIARLAGGQKSALLAGILLSQLCLLASVLLIGPVARGSKEVLGGKGATLYEEPGFWLLVSPLTFFLLVFYAESLFLFLTLLMITTYRKSLFGTACVVGILAGLTRPTAVCLPALFIVDVASRYRQGRPITLPLACLFAPLLGVVLYAGYVYYLMGDPMGYFHIQADSWDAGSSLPFVPLARDLGSMLNALTIGKIGPVHQCVRLFSSITILALTIWGWRRLDPSFLTYLIVALFFIHSREPPHSTARWELVVFPIYILLSRAMRDRPRIALPAAGVSFALQIMLFIRYATWKFVA
jgi:hypothetical protein